MKKLYFTLAMLCLSFLSHSQLRMALIGGPHSASVKEENSLPSWETTVKPGYSSRPGVNVGILAEVPISSNSRWFLHPGIQYMAKGRKFSMQNNLSDTVSQSSNLSVNYIEIPFNLSYKIPMGKKAKLLLSAGPYLSFFYNAKQKFESRIKMPDSSFVFSSDEIRIESGKGEGKIKTADAGFNVRAGFEIGNVLLTGFLSQGLTSFYTASYDGTFKHNVKGISVGFWLNKPKQPVAKKPKDSDKDGIMDSADACPHLAGPAITQGCPDKDDDGIADKDDQCPDVPGILKYRGCPVPDSDGDGINDEADACPNLAGVPEFNGCPVPDSDGDGVNDLEDRCTTEAGPASNQGCPEVKEIKKEIVEKVNFAAKNILFRASSDQLTAGSSQPLNEIVKVMETNPSFKLIIEGHTDVSGDDSFNKILSSKRAQTVKNYLLQSGIEENRITATGFGSSKPLVSNETLEGRAKNRRVELKIVP